MMQITRYLLPSVKRFLERKMVFLGGPRQVGKTHLCLSILDPATNENPAYLNWDDLHHRKKIRNAELPQAPLIVMDEIHKYRAWRGLIKGLYDTRRPRQNYLVTGSARLDHYRQGGDSLLGRYRYLRLHPLSVAELGITKGEELAALLRFGGFPEPYFLQSEQEWKMWQNERRYRIIEDDIRDLERLREFSTIESLMDLLPSRVGSPLSIQSLSEDLGANHRTVENWIRILERVYYCYRIPPFGPPRVKAVKKEQKLYLWDWSTIEEPGFRFENFVASHLLKYSHFVEDTQGDRMELRYLRTVEKREIDFVVLKNKKPIFAVECKTGERALSPQIPYFAERTPIPFFYQVHLGSKDVLAGKNIRILPFCTFSKEVALV